ncbi:MAG: FkbM family methyltransferase [Pseudonocardiaceae bacterium]
MTKDKLAERLTPQWGSWEPGTVELMRRTVREGDVVFDVGAHVGYYATLLSTLVGPGGGVHAFEPHPGNFQVLSRNTAELANVTVVNTAVTEHPGRRLLHFSSNTGRHSLFRTEFTGGAGRSLEVPTATLDDYWAGIGCPPVALVKIDVEGAEPLVIRGARAFIDANPGIRVISEYYPRNLRWDGGDEQAYLALLGERDLRCWAIHDDGTLTDALPELTGDDYINILCQRDSLDPTPEVTT